MTAFADVAPRIIYSLAYRASFVVDAFPNAVITYDFMLACWVAQP